jgi:protein Mpv17
MRSEISSKSMTRHSKTILGRLQHTVIRHPIASNSLLCLGLWAMGDIAAQYSEHKIQDHNQQQQSQSSTPRTPTTTSATTTTLDLKRTAECSAYGAVVDGPLLAVWYPCMERVCTYYHLAARYGMWGPPVAKAVIDQLIMEPPCLVVFFGYMNACEGGSLQTFQQKLDTQLLPSWMASLAVWPVVLLGTFRWLPLYAQAPFSNVCLVAWNGFLSHRNTLSQQNENRQVVVVQDKTSTVLGGSSPTSSVAGRGDEALDPRHHTSLLLSERIEAWKKRVPIHYYRSP